MDTCYAYGTNLSQLRERYREAHGPPCCAPGPSKYTFAFNGRPQPAALCEYLAAPSPGSRNPPIWISGGGSVETWRWCAEMGTHVYCYLSYYGYKAGRATMDGFWEEMKRLGKQPNPYHAGFPQFVGVGDPGQHAFDLQAARPRNTSTAAACTSTRAGRPRPAIPARQPARRHRRIADQAGRRMPTCAANPARRTLRLGRAGDGGDRRQGRPSSVGR